ncbi:PTS system oligo-beta-mannoside-specific EIIC component [Listeria grayi]|uniref:Permease IIC component n=1 Tax=Listeria grayi TaxID=1641 RepID=A0A378MK97_LISGR|nr:PTS sugar transporter subunit IIC [Listeria grayi]STY44185.1 PTS system oligo-beta-mannoside-specific EIIC component [Listeria grayi]
MFHDIFTKMEKYLLPISARIGAQRHMLAIRDAFSSIMAALIVGSVASLINNFPYQPFQDFMTAVFTETWKEPGNIIYNMTMGILGLLVAISIGYYLAQPYKLDGISSALMSGISFLILTPFLKDGSPTLDWLGAKGLFVAMIVGIFTTEIYHFIVKQGWTIKMPEGVPPAVTSGFVALIPSFVIFILVGLIASVLKATTGLSLTEIIYQLLQAPFQQIGDTIPAMCLLMFARGFLWFFGIHGTNVLDPISDSIILPNIEENARYFAQGVSAYDVPKIATSSFISQFVSIGGTGVGLAFVIAVIIISRSKATRKLSIGATPGVLFNINEPILYGVPIVLNASLIIPFLLTPIVLIIVGYIAMGTVLVPKTVALVPWNMPVLIGGYLSTGGSFRGVILQIVDVVIATLIYLPFIKLNDRVEAKINVAEKQKSQRIDKGAKMRWEIN